MTYLLSLIPIVAFAYVQIIQPVADRIAPGALNTQVVWPALFALTLMLALFCRKHMDFSVLLRAPGLLLIAFLCYAAVSILWAFSPPETVKRWLQAVMLIAVMLVPFAVRDPKIDVMAGIFWCFAAAIIINSGFVLSTPPMLAWTGVELGHSGYFLHKQYLGMCASCAILVAFYSLLAGKRRLLSVAMIGASVWLVVASNSKTALGFALLTPLIATIVFFGSGKLKLPMAAVLAAIPIAYFGLAAVISNLASRVAFRVYGDATFTGRIFIWDFIETQTALKPWFGWGFRSFWFVPFSPINNAPGFVRDMPSSHSGYLDMRLETGYVGLAIFLAFVVAAVYSLEHVRRINPRRAFALLALFIYILIMNLMETICFIHFDPLWVLFLLVTGEAMRHSTTAFAAPLPPDAQLTKPHLFSQSRVGLMGLQTANRVVVAPP